MRNKRYYLFSSLAHDDIEFGFPQDLIESVKELWNEGETSKEICNQLKLKPIELALIVMDLDYAGHMNVRDGGFFG